MARKKIEEIKKYVSYGMDLILEIERNKGLKKRIMEGDLENISMDLISTACTHDLCNLYGEKREFKEPQTSLLIEVMYNRLKTILKENEEWRKFNV